MNITGSTRVFFILGDPVAQARGADGKLEAALFDGIGFVKGLDHFGIDAEGKRVLVVGAGGGGHAVAAAIAQRGPSALAVFNRTREPAALRPGARGRRRGGGGHHHEQAAGAPAAPMPRARDQSRGGFRARLRFDAIARTLQNDMSDVRSLLYPR
jgi:hypothetical protein